MISAILLAAGESRRMGRPKQLLEWQGGTLLQQSLESYLKSDVDETILVLGHEADRIRNSLPDLQIKIVLNLEYQRGMASSLRKGLLALDRSSEAFLIALADQPNIGSDIVNRLIREFRQAFPQRGIVRPVYKGLPGHPVLLHIRYLKEAMLLEGDVGARQIIANHSSEILEVEVGDDGILKDIDTPDQYRNLIRKRERRGP